MATEYQNEMAVESEEDDSIVRMINSAAALRSETLDLGAKRIYEIPNEILTLKHLEVGFTQNNLFILLDIFYHVRILYRNAKNASNFALFCSCSRSTFNRTI